MDGPNIEYIEGLKVISSCRLIERNEWFFRTEKGIYDHELKPIQKYERPDVWDVIMPNAFPYIRDSQLDGTRAMKYEAKSSDLGIDLNQMM